MKPPKILFLSMDAGDRLLIRQWAKDGTMPTLQGLLAGGLVGETTSVEGFYEGSTWPSFYTGMSPAHHGFHRLNQLIPGTYGFHQCRPGEFIKQEPFWNHLSRAGRRVTILDVPLTGISRGLNGIQMVEWASHDGVYGFHTWPRGLRRDVLRRFGPHPVESPCDSDGRSPREFLEFKYRLLAGVEKKCELTLHYMARGDWDFFAQVFTEGHCAGHQCWHLHDPAHPNYDPEVVAQTGDPVLESYRAIDRAIGRILAHVDEDTLVFFLASHRMSHNLGGSFLLGTILERLHLMKRTTAIAVGGQQGVPERIVAAAKKGFQRLPDPVRTALTPLCRSARRCLAGEDRPQIPSGIDVASSRCFLHQNGNLVSGIRVNLAGREPGGLVKPGKELNELCRQLAGDLLRVVDADTGRRAVRRVIRTSEVYQGELVDHLPDLLVEWSDEVSPGSKAVCDDGSCRLRVASEKIGVIEGDYTYCRTGDHRPEGLFVAVGPGIGPGTIARTISIMDFASTFLRLFGLEGPGFDGRLITEITGSGGA